jgi:hypothetical protein
MQNIVITLRVTAPDRETARVAVRHQQFSVGRPLELDEASQRIAAIEYALGAVGGEVVNGLRVFAARARVVVDAVEAVVSGELEHGLAYLEVVGEQGPPSLARIRIKVYAASPDETATRTLFERMLCRLPLVNTLRNTVDMTFELIHIC